MISALGSSRVHTRGLLAAEPDAVVRKAVRIGVAVDFRSALSATPQAGCRKVQFTGICTRATDQGPTAALEIRNAAWEWIASAVQATTVAIAGGVVGFNDAGPVLTRLTGIVLAEVVVGGWRARLPIGAGLTDRTAGRTLRWRWRWRRG